jgi:isopentenyl-diphosphate Delta-isomerase
MEEVIVVNEKDEQIGIMSKEEAHKDGTAHRIAVTYVENGKGQFLVQIRMSGALDHSSAGHVHPGESYMDAAKRELAEELGIVGVELRKVGHGVCKKEVSHDGGVRTHVFDIFACVAEPGQLQQDEVKGVYWADPQEVLKDMQNSTTEVSYAGGFKVSLPIYLESR